MFYPSTINIKGIRHIDMFLLNTPNIWGKLPIIKEFTVYIVTDTYYYSNATQSKTPLFV